MEKKLKILYLGLEYHLKTKSSYFLIEMLERKYDVSYASCTSGFGEIKADNNLLEKNYDVLICWQVMPPLAYLNSMIKYKKGVLFPMYDSFINTPAVAFYDYYKFTIISFSKAIFDKLSCAGFNVKYIQYYPKPVDRFDQGNEKSAFFWYRVNAINMGTVNALLSNINLKKLHLHNAPDPEMPEIERIASASYEIEESTWFPDILDVKLYMEKSAYYIAPRPVEGIGMGFLDAMAMGRCVVAPDNPTLNEYITNEETGILYDIKNIKPIKCKNVREIQRNAYEYICKGYQVWNENKEYIYKWIEEDTLKIELLYKSDKYVSEANKYYKETTIAERMAVEHSNLKCYLYYRLYEQWMQNYFKGKKIESYLKSRGINSVAIYGMGKVGARLYDELKNSSIIVEYALDKMPKTDYEQLRIYRPDIIQSLKQIDTIIVTPIESYGEIKRYLKTLTEINILSLFEIVYELS